MATFDPRQIQAKFKHAGDFGITGKFNKENAAKFEAALQAHINAPTTQTIVGTYRGVPVLHKFDPSTSINVILDPMGNFITGWKLSPDQINFLITRNALGGG